MTILALVLGHPVGYAYRKPDGTISSGAQLTVPAGRNDLGTQEFDQWFSRTLYYSASQRAVYVCGNGCENMEQALTVQLRGTVVPWEKIQPGAVQRFIAGDPDVDDRTLVDRVLAAGHFSGTTTEAEAGMEKPAPAPLESADAQILS